MEGMLYFLSAAFTFGLTAGLSPGPLSALAISETLQRGRKEGIKVALAPIFTDGPIIFLSLYFLTKVTDLHLLLGFISLFGACFLGYMAYGSFLVKGIEAKVAKHKSRSFKRGIITNILNPYMYVFHFTTGGPYLLKAMQLSTNAAILFIGTFFLLLVGTKIVIVLIVERSKTLLKSKGYVYTMRALGVVLLVFAFIFARDALKFWGVI